MENGMKAGVVAAVCLCAVGACSCSGPTVSAFGESDDLVVVSEQGATHGADALLRGVLETEDTWLVGEAPFKTTVVTPEELGSLTNRRHILLVGTWSDEGIADIVRRRVGGLEPGDPPALRIVEDIWAKGQVVGVIMADDDDGLAGFVKENGDTILLELESAVARRLMRTLKARAAEGGTKEGLEERFGWSLSPPSGYDFITTHSDVGFVFFRRTRPDRTIFVYWQPGGPADVTEEFATAKRAALAARYYDGDEIEWRREFVVETDEFGGRAAIRLSGWWGNRELVGGGPFRTYCFCEESQGRVYLVDASLFAPGLDKTALMRNLDAALQTFETTPVDRP
jgi:hypothetical protein